MQPELFVLFSPALERRTFICRIFTHPQIHIMREKSNE